MILERMSLGVYGTNCYIVACEETKEAMVIDPGGEVKKIINKAKEHNLNVKFIALTHGHGDHIGALKELKDESNAIVVIHKEDEELLTDAHKNYSAQMSMENVNGNADKLLQDGEIIQVGQLSIEVIHTPGHTKGSVCFKANDCLFSGDTLFAKSIGRTDLHGGSFDDIINSIRNKLIILDEDVKVFPGHGPATTIGKEKANNPYI